MNHVLYAATRLGYCVQVMQGGEIVHSYSAGNCGKESQTVVAPRSPNAISLRQLTRWAKQTAGHIAKERGIPVDRISYDPDLEEQLREEDAQWARV
jgi:hypothetical protein